MGKIVIEYEKHDKTFWQKYWGLILFPLLPFWLLGRDDGMAGWLDINGHSVKLKYRKKAHPQIIEMPNGQNEIVYRKKSNLALAIHAWSRQGNEGMADALDRMGAYDDYKLTGMVLDFGPETVLTLSARGGRFLRECTVTDLTGVPEREEEPTSGVAPAAAEKGGCLKNLLIGFAALLVIGLIVSFLMTRLTEQNPVHMGGDLPANTTTTTDGDTTTSSATTTTTTTAVGPTKYVVADGGLRLREQPNAGSTVLVTIPNETAVVIEDTQGDWAKVTYDGNTGWCSLAYLFDSLADGATRTTATTTTTTTTTAAVDENYIVEQGIQEANFHIVYYEGQLVSGAITKDTLTEDEVLALYHKARSAYERATWSNVTGVFIPIEGKPVYHSTPDSHLHGSMTDEWRAGRDPEFADFEALCQHYFSCLSDSLTKTSLLNHIALIDHCMYYTDYPGMGDEGVKHELSYAVNTTATGYEVVVTGQYYRDYENPDLVTSTEVFTFPCEKEDGAWVFTHMEWIPS